MLATRQWRINQVTVDLCSADLYKTLLSSQAHLLMFTLHLWVLFEPATEVVFWEVCRPDQLALANISKCNGNCLSSSDYCKTHTHTHTREI